MKLSCFPDIFGDKNLSPTKLYFSLYGEFANTHRLIHHNLTPDVVPVLVSEYGNNEDFHITQETSVFSGRELKLDYLIAILDHKLILIFERNMYISVLYDSSQAILDRALEIITPYTTVLNNEEGRFCMIIQTGSSSFKLISFDSKRMNINIPVCYNDDFQEVHREITSFVEADNRSGLVILHGKQGTGKTSYIRNIIHNTKRKVIYMGSDIVAQIANPAFLPFISDHKDSLIILEDCEELLMSRNNNKGVNSGLINILNMSDGLLGDALNLKFICTFNAPLKDIDKALLRKGRLVARYEFGDLDPAKANAIIKEKNLDIPTQTQAISLAELFNYDKRDFEQKHKKIGF